MLFSSILVYTQGVLWKFRESKKNSLIISQSDSAGKQLFVGQVSGRKSKDRPMYRVNPFSLHKGLHLIDINSSLLFNWKRIKV